MKKLTVYKAVKLYCSNDCETSPQAARKCPKKECFLYRFRMGNNPNLRKRHSTTTPILRNGSGKFQPLYKGQKPPKIIGLSKKGKLRIKLPSGAILNVDIQEPKGKEVLCVK